MTQPGFEAIAVVTKPDLDRRFQFPLLRKLNWTLLPQEELNVELARRLLLSLTPPVAPAAQTDT